MMDGHVSSTTVNANCAPRLHCGHDNGYWSIAMHDGGSPGPAAVYIYGTHGELERLGYAILQIAAGLTVEGVAQ